MYLLNGNHHITWIHSKYATQTYQFEQAQAKFSKAPVSSHERKDAEEVMHKLGTYLHQNVVWLVKFFDYGKKYS